jgi:predicted  nucleic acid-binding Zn-ribbon protein
MAGNETTLKELGEMLTHVVDHMATKDDIVRLDEKIDRMSEQLAGIEADVRDIKRRLGIIEEDVQGMKGYAKEIDDLRESVRVIEQHLNVKKRQVA